MSRCFPFPPPGYEKKARTDDADLLKKEKHREKKHKKEKREKEKKEGKEKREKDRGDGRHKEKKDRKDKHRDRKKDKEKDREKEKDKNITSDEKRLASEFEGFNAEKLSQKEVRDRDKNSVSNEKRFAGQLVGYNEEKLTQSSHLGEGNKDSKFLQELGRRIRAEDGGNGNQLVEKFTGTDRRKDEAMARLVAKDVSIRTEGKEKNKDKRGEDRKIDGQGVRDESRISGNSVAQSLAGTGLHRLEGTPKPLEKKIERRMEAKEKTKDKEGDDKRGDKRKDRDREKKSQGKEKDRDKEKRKEEKEKEKIEHKNKELDKSKESNKDDVTVTHNIKTSHLHKDSNKSAATEGNHRKRKDSDTNGFLHVNEVKPNKLPRPTSHPLIENGRKLEPCQTSILITSDRQGGTANNLKVENKEHKLNGIIGAQPFSVASTKPLSVASQADQIADASKKPPHPDSKYLSQVLSVPKMEEWSDFDDQEWLFSSSISQSEKPKMGSSGGDETPQVWAEALQVDSADIYALPYVIPY